MTLSTGGFSRVVTFPTAPIATGRSDPCRKGLAPSREPCLSTAHAYVCALDLEKLGFRHAGGGIGAGQPSYDPADLLKVGVHAQGYVAASDREAVEDFYPGYAHTMTTMGRERGWPPMTRASFEAQRSRTGALIVGGPDEVLEKIRLYDEALGGISRITFQMNAGSLPQAKMMRAIELLGTRVTPVLHKELVAR